MLRAANRCSMPPANQSHDAGAPAPARGARRHGATGISNGCSSRRRSLLILALSIYPLLFSLWVAFVNYDFQIPGHAFVGLKNFQQVVFDPVARWSLVLTVMLSVANVTIEFLLGLALALAMVQDLPRPRPGHVDPDRAAVHQPGHRRPGLGAPAAAAVRPDQLSPRPAARRRRHDRLADRKPVELRRARSSPTSGSGRRSCSSSCSPG